jgi:membrane associated rhomboid family serine protease
MFFFLPVGLDQRTVRRLPWVTFALMAMCTVVFIVMSFSAQAIEKRAVAKRIEAVTYWTRHPYLEFPERLLPADAPRAQREQIKRIAEATKSLQAARPESLARIEHEQAELDQLADAALELAAQHPFWRWGLIPAVPDPVAFLTCMFVHAGWLHLLGNLLMLYLSGPFIEDAFGRPIFLTLYLLGGFVASLVQVSAFPNSTTPIVGASGAIAAVMGAFLVRFARRRVRFVYFLWLLLLPPLTGTFTVAALLVLPLWLVQQFLLASAGSAGVAYWAHVGGFVFGFAVALVVRLLGIEARFVSPAIERKISVTQHPGLERGMELIGRGEAAGASSVFRTVLASEPHNVDAHLALWQSLVNAGNARDGVGHMVRVIESELKRGEITLAVGHWRELTAVTDASGPPTLRWRLAAAVEPTDWSAAVDILRSLTDDAEAGVLAEKARRRLGALGVGYQPPKPVVALPDAGAPAPAPHEEPTPAPPAEAEPATGAGATLPEVEIRGLAGLGADSLVLKGADGAAEILPLSQIEAVVVGGIKAAKPYLLLDLLLRRSGTERGRVVRFLSTAFDPRVVMKSEGRSPLEAFRDLVREISERAGAPVVPAAALREGGRFLTFETTDEYEQALLSPLA